MMKLEELKSAITKLSPKKLAELRNWFVKETARRERLQDQADLQVFEDRRREPTISYEKFRGAQRTKVRGTCVIRCGDTLHRPEPVLVQGWCTGRELKTRH